LFLNHGLEVEEYGPAAGIANQIWSEAAIEAWNWVLLCDELFEDAEGADGRAGGVAVDWDVSELSRGQGRGRVLLWRRVLITSRGWTARVEIVPAERPAILSTSAGERRAWFSFISMGGGLVLSW
jgi:hypothetical protein